MMRPVETQIRSLEDALYILSNEKDIPDAAILDKVICAFPEFAEEITDFAIDIAVDSLKSKPSESEPSTHPVRLGTVSPAVSRAMSRFQNRLHAAQTVSVASHTEQNLARSRHDFEVKNPFLKMGRDEFRNLAQRMDVNATFVSKLRDRQIDLDTIPLPFQSRLANEMHVPLELIIAHLRASPVEPQGQFYKSVGKPHSSTRQTFLQAVRGSGLSRDQQDALLRL